MTQRFGVAHAVRLCLVACAAAVLASFSTSAIDKHAADLNGDGRPDAWRTYDSHGVIAELTLDTNFDGRSDVREYYEHGALVRRESDRDFNDRVDVIQRFDVETKQHESTIVDVDADGSADLLVLFRDGRPVFSKWAHSLRPANTSAKLARQNIRRSSRGWMMANPFAGDVVLHADDVPREMARAVGLSTSGALPSPALAISRPFDPKLTLIDLGVTIPPQASAASRAPRGPPSLLSVLA